MNTFLDFEKPIAELEGKIKELRHLSDGGGDVNISDEVGRLEAKVDQVLHQIYDKLTPWQKIQVARHPDRPHFSAYIDGLIDDFTELHGGPCLRRRPRLDRRHGALPRPPGHGDGTRKKAADTAGRVAHNFGMANPEGYRKATRLMELANRFSLPVLTFVDTPGGPTRGSAPRSAARPRPSPARSRRACT